MCGYDTSLADLLSKSSPSSLGLILVPNTLLHTVYSKYSLVLSIDISPTSMASVDPVTGDVLFDRVFSVIQKIMQAMV